MRGILSVVAPTAALLVGCALGGDDPSIEQAVGARASLSLVSSNAAIANTSDTAWTLSKTGQVDPAASTVTWQVTATQGSTTAGQLVLTGGLTVHNSGALGATIGNIVVNLQARSNNQWVTRSSDVADATSDDAATTANIAAKASSENRGTFTENAASGQLVFTDASTNSVFALVPQQTIAPGATVELRYSATFDNTVLNLAPGTPVRAELIVSFGNSAPAGAATSPNIDINGNGVIDADEDFVRSVPSRLSLAVPAQTPSNTTITLTDTLADIVPTGTVTITDAEFALGATSGTVIVTYDAGASGGTLTNCAHLTGTSQSSTIPTLALEACNTQTIGAQTCTPGSPGCGWNAGDVVTFTQVAWGTPTNPAALLLASNYASVYPGGLFEVGIPGPAGFSMLFTTANAVITYLPPIGTIGVLVADLLNPTSSNAGFFGGEVVALELNLDFADAGLVPNTTGLRLGDLRVCGTGVVAADGLTVRQLAAALNIVLGGGSAPSPLLDLHLLTQNLNGAFVGGNPSVFAQQHLVAGACP